jgi:GNAT superfamily N-acetyltransferase
MLLDHLTRVWGFFGGLDASVMGVSGSMISKSGESHRRKGYARASLALLEQWCRDRGVPQMALNVFSYNSGAEKLYRDLGFEDMSKQMRKLLG